MSERIDEKARSYTMSRIRKTNTKPEVLVRKFLFSKGLRYRIYVKGLKGNPDIVLPKYETLVFVNGCFWHCHEGCKYNKFPKSRQEYWVPKLKGNVERDIKNKALLEEQGWRVLVIWECELEKSKMEGSLNKLYKNIVDGKKADNRRQRS